MWSRPSSTASTQLVERHPAHLDLGLLLGAEERRRPPRGRAPRRPDELLAAARRGREVDEHRSTRLGHEVGLFGELALAPRRAGPRRRTSSRPAGISQSRSAHRVAVLVDERAHDRPRRARARRRRRGDPCTRARARGRRTRIAPGRCPRPGPRTPRSLEHESGTSAGSSLEASAPAVTTLSAGARRRRHEQARLLALERRADEPAEQRMRAVRAAAQLGVGLGADVERVHVARQLDELDEVPVGRDAREPTGRPRRCGRGSGC